jgi:hypothetical protein
MSKWLSLVGLIACAMLIVGLVLLWRWGNDPANTEQSLEWGLTGLVLIVFSTVGLVELEIHRRVDRLQQQIDTLENRLRATESALAARGESNSSGPQLPEKRPAQRESSQPT